MRIQSLEQVQAFVNVDNTFSHEVLGAHELIALSDFINNYFSTPFIDSILNSTSEETVMDEAQTAVYGALISFSVYKWSFQGEVKVGDLGILRTENQEAKTAYSGQVKNFRDSLMENGNIYIAALIQLIEKNQELFTDFDKELAFINRSQLIIKSTLDFNQRIAMVQPYLLFPKLTDCQLYAVEFEIRKILTDAITDNFIEGIADDDENKAIKEKALSYTKNAIAAFTIKEAFKRNLVRQTTAGIVLLSSDKDTDQQIYSAADTDRIHKQIGNFETIANTWISRAEAYLIENNILAAPEVATPKTFIA